MIHKVATTRCESVMQNSWREKSSHFHAPTTTRSRTHGERSYRTSTHLLPPVAGTVTTRSRRNIDVSKTRREVSVRLRSKRASDTPWLHFTPTKLAARKFPSKRGEADCRRGRLNTPLYASTLKVH
eukprot:4330040-Pleurochrysis_carterae.AAC.1